MNLDKDELHLNIWIMKMKICVIICTIAVLCTCKTKKELPQQAVKEKEETVFNMSTLDTTRIDTVPNLSAKWSNDIWKNKMDAYKAKYHNLYTENLVTPYTVSQAEIDALQKKGVEHIAKVMKRVVECNAMYTLDYPPLSKAEDFERCTYKTLHGFLITANVFDYNDPDNQRFGNYLTLDTTKVISMVYKDGKYLTNLIANFTHLRYGNWTSDDSVVEKIKLAQQLSDNVFFIRYPNGRPMVIGYLSNDGVYFIKTKERIVEYSHTEPGMRVFNEIKTNYHGIPAKDYMMRQGHTMFDYYEDLIREARSNPEYYRKIYQNSQVKVFPEE
jgi:hypothetical protein